MMLKDIYSRLRFGLVNSILFYTKPNVIIHICISEIFETVLLFDNQLKLFFNVCRKYKMVMSYHNILV